MQILRAHNGEGVIGRAIMIWVLFALGAALCVGFSDVLAKNLKIMDGSSIALARDNNIPIIVFPINKKNAFLDAIFNRGKYTIIK